MCIRDRSPTVNCDVENGLNKFKHVCGAIHRTLKYKTSKDTKLKFKLETMAVPVAQYGSETWVFSQRDRAKVTSAVIIFLRSFKKCTSLARISNAWIRRELQIFKLQGRIIECRANWCKHLGRMKQDRLPKLVLNYEFKGYRSVGRPKTRRVSACLLYTSRCV